VHGFYLAHLIVDGAIMNQNLKYPKWRQSLVEALLEFDPQQLLAKVQRAEESIVRRYRELAFEMRNQEELRQLSDGLSIIRDLKEGRLGALNPKGE
jgi:hypothetical protein